MPMRVVPKPVCRLCGTTMRKESPIYGGEDVWVCPFCGDGDAPDDNDRPVTTGERRAA